MTVEYIAIRSSLVENLTFENVKEVLMLNASSEGEEKRVYE